MAALRCAAQGLDNVWGGSTDAATGQLGGLDLSTWSGTGRFAASKITGVAAAGLTDGDVAQGAGIAGNGTAYNYLSHDQFQSIAERLDQCATESCRDDIIDDALALSQQQDLEALAICANHLPGCGAAVLTSMTTPFDGIEFDNPETATYLRELSWENPGKAAAFTNAVGSHDAAALVRALDPESSLSPEKRAAAEEAIAGLLSSGAIGADRGGYTGGRGVTKPSTGTSGSGGKRESGGLGESVKGTSIASAVADTRKFSDYIFKPGADHGKDAVFKSLGYTADDSAALSKAWQQQAAEKYAKGEFKLGKADQYGQRIDIEIALPGKGLEAGKVSYLRSGWMIQPDGSLKLNTPFSGFTRRQK